MLNGGLRSFLIAGKAAAAEALAKAQVNAEELSAPRKTRSMPGKGTQGQKRKRYINLDESDDEFFERMERGEESEEGEGEEQPAAGVAGTEAHSAGRDWMYKSSGRWR